MKRVILFVCAPLVLGSRSNAQQIPGTPVGWPAFVQVFDACAAAGSVVGGSALMMRDGRVLVHHEYGFGDRDLAQPVDGRTIYHWASITKTLTAIAIMQLRDRGRLSLDDKVTSYVPELRQVHDPFGSMDDITIRMLLSHTAGFQDPTWPYKAGKAWEPFEPTRWEQLVAMMPYQEIAFTPGSRFGYSNPAFIYLARIIEHLTGDPYEVYIQKNIWNALGMTRSYFGITPYYLSRWRSNNYTARTDSSGVPRVEANGREFDPGITIPNGGWNAPLSDLATYVAFLTHATRSDTAAGHLYDIVLRQSSLQEMWRPVVSLGPSGAGAMSFGLSFFLGLQGDSAIVWHSGSQAGFRSLLYINPRTTAALITVVNTAVEGTLPPAAVEACSTVSRLVPSLLAH